MYTGKLGIRKTRNQVSRKEPLKIALRRPSELGRPSQVLGERPGSSPYSIAILEDFKPAGERISLHQNRIVPRELKRFGLPETKEKYPRQ